MQPRAHCIHGAAKAVRERCGSGAGAVRERCGNGAETARERWGSGAEKSAEESYYCSAGTNSLNYLIDRLFD